MKTPSIQITSLLLHPGFRRPSAKANRAQPVETTLCDSAPSDTPDVPGSTGGGRRRRRRLGTVCGILAWLLLLMSTLAPAQEPLHAALVREDPPDAPEPGRTRHEVLLGMGKDVVLEPRAAAEVVVAIFGNAKVRGHVTDTVVAVVGDVEVDGPVEGDVVAVGGSVALLSGARVQGEVVSVGGRVTVDPAAELRGQVQEIQLGHWGLGGLATWIRECVLKMRPLSLAVGWVWLGYAILAFFYLLLVLLFPRAIQACAVAVEERPASTLLLGLLTKLLVPIVGFVLVLTGFGVLLVPVLLLAVVLAGLVGKAGFLVYLGRHMLRGGLKTAPLLGAFLLGLLLLTALYLVPFVGLLTLVITGLWGLGAAVVALWSGLRQEINPASGGGAPPPAMTGPAGAPPAAPLSPAPPAPGSGTTLPGAGPSVSGGSPHPPGATPPPIEGPTASPLPEPASASADLVPAPPRVPPRGEWALPRAGFGERLGAALLDAVVVALLFALVGGPPVGWLLALLYFAGFWTWRGTTVGGVVFKLRVVRLDGRPLRLEVALVRALGAVVSTAALFLGFLWIAWDPDRQSWHDKLVGTVVVRLPQSPPLLCL